MLKIRFPAFLKSCLALGVFLLAVQPSGIMAEEMVISGAASLTEAFTELKSIFEKQRPDLTAHVNFASSNLLLKQMQEGAPVDVFASADQATMDKAVELKIVDPATRADFARNGLVLIVPKGEKPIALKDIQQFERIAVGNPDSVPAGRYARDALVTAKLWDAVQPKLILGASVRQTLDYVARGEVNAGFVYATDAIKQADKVDVVMPLTGHASVLYPIAVALTGKNPKMGKAFLDYILSAEGQAVLGKYGFAKP
ncbi:molybdate ABC transporter substrate-binding protein [Deltaproteobacteria bacterium]|nr:molybdate ABC transporter substrate-binding protein [Deltaproteobacteria bacterium]